MGWLAEAAIAGSAASGNKGAHALLGVGKGKETPETPKNDDPNSMGVKPGDVKQSGFSMEDTQAAPKPFVHPAQQSFERLQANQDPNDPMKQQQNMMLASLYKY